MQGKDVGMQVSTIANDKVQKELAVEEEVAMVAGVQGREGNMLIGQVHDANIIDPPLDSEARPGSGGQAESSQRCDLPQCFYPTISTFLVMTKIQNSVTQYILVCRILEGNSLNLVKLLPLIAPITLLTAPPIYIH